MTDIAGPSTLPASPRDLRQHAIDDVLAYVERGLGVRFDRHSMVRKRRSVGGRTDRETWVRIEVRSIAKIMAHGQAGNGMEAAALLCGVAKPQWFGALCWHDRPREVVWRADEVELVTAAPVRSGGPVREDIQLSDTWWRTLNTSLASLADQHTTRIATPDTELLTQALVTTEIDRAFPGKIDTTITDDKWVPAHADLNWSNVTSPECWIIDWEDYGLAPRGLDSANLWISSLSIPHLAERVSRHRRVDLDTRPGRLMALFKCAKTLNDSSTPERVAEQAARIATHLIGSLRQ